MITVTAIIPNWNGAGRLGSLVRQLHEQSHRVEQIVVVDNASEDNSVVEARRLGATVIALPHNSGFAAAVNRGIEMAQTPFVAILNNDVQLAPNWLERLVTAIGDHAFATGKLLRAEQPSIIDGTFDLVSLAGCAWRCGEGRQDDEVWSRSRVIALAPLTAAIFRRDLFERVGYLDERFVSYLEDVDFGLRSASKGYTGIYVPGAVALHEGSATWGRWNARTVRQIARNQVLLVAKHYTGRDLIRCGWKIAVGQCLWGAVAMRHGQILAWLRGKLDGLGGMRQIVRLPDARIAAAIADSEAQLLELQRTSRFDTYWRMYFALT